MPPWKIIAAAFFTLAFCIPAPLAPEEPEFCYQVAQVEHDKFSGPKDERLRELIRIHSDSIILRAVRESCDKDIASFLATPDEVDRLPSLCQYFRLEDYQKLREALIAQ